MGVTFEISILQKPLARSSDNDVLFLFQSKLIIIYQIMVFLKTFVLQTFHIDDYELQILQKGYCPFCRATPEHMISQDSDDFLS